MHFFQQSLVSPLLYTSQDTLSKNIAFFSIDSVINQPINSKDRKDLNKIYEQADIFTKRNSIVTINNKKQKKLLNSSMNIDRFQPRPLLGKQDLHTSLPIMGKQGALFQEIHPADVQKNHDDNIFDYRLHMKLGRGEEVFKVEEVKRKQKKKMSGKQCQCCGRQFSKYHKCAHTICERKCGKPNLKRGESRRDISSMYSDSKDENWSQQNYDEQKGIRGRNQKKISKIQQSISSNKQDNNYGEAPQHLLLSIEKLITQKVLNNFSYRVLQIKQFEQKQESDKEMEEQENLYEQSLDQNNSNLIIYPSETHQSQFKKNIKPPQNQIYKQQLSSNINMLLKFSYQQENYKQADNILFNQKKETKNKMNSEIQQKPSINQIQSHQNPNTYQMSLNKDDHQIEVQNQQNIQQNQQIIVQNQQIIGYNQEIVGQNQLQEGEGQQQTNKGGSENQQKKNQNNNQHSKNNQNQLNQPSPSIILSNKKSFSSGSSSSSQHIDQLVEDLPQEALIPMNEEDKDNLMLNQNQNPLTNSKSNVQSFQRQNQSLKQDHLKEQLPLPDYNQVSDSLQDQIQDIQQKNPIQHQTQQLSQTPLIKISKKQSKQLKIIEKQKLKTLQRQKLKSQKIQEIQLNAQIQSQKNNQQIITQNKKQIQNQKAQKHGKGKGTGMGRGHGIFQQQLEIYSEDSSLLQQDNDKQKSQLFSKIQQKPISKSLNSIDSEQFNLGSKSSINYQPGTPRRRIPNMEKIIEQIKMESSKIEKEKGLGRGKIFGRGLGVLDQTQQLEKQLQNDEYLIGQGEKSGKKKVKVDKNNSKQKGDVKDNKKRQRLSKQNDKKEKIIEVDDKKKVGFGEGQNGDVFMDKFDELINQEDNQILVDQLVDEKSIVCQNNGNNQASEQISRSKVQQNIQKQEIAMQNEGQINLLNQDIQKQQLQQDLIVFKQELNYINYLNKKETLIHPQISASYPSSQENINLENQLQQNQSDLELNQSQRVQQNKLDLEENQLNKQQKGSHFQGNSPQLQLKCDDCNIIDEKQIEQIIDLSNEPSS